MLKGSGDRELRQEQYLLWLLASKMASAASYLVFWYCGVTLVTLAPPSGQTNQHRMVLKGSGDRKLCQEQYLFWLLA